jgi:hypothetical protein
MDEQRHWVIYGLYRPDRPIFYIGRTFDMARRLKEHRQHFKGRIYAKILEAGTGDEHGEAENWWIEHYRRLGYTIANRTEGGNGAQRLSADTKRKMSAKTKGRPKSPDHVAKIAAAQRGKPKNWSSEGAAKIAETQFKAGRNSWADLSEDARQRKAEIHRQQLLAQTPEQRSQQSTNAWASYTPKQRQERINRTREGRWGNKSPEQRRAPGVSAYWAAMTPEEKAAEFAKRIAKRRENAQHESSK